MVLMYTVDCCRSCTLYCVKAYDYHTPNSNVSYHHFCVDIMNNYSYSTVS